MGTGGYRVCNHPKVEKEVETTDKAPPFPFLSLGRSPVSLATWSSADQPPRLSVWGEGSPTHPASFLPAGGGGGILRVLQPASVFHQKADRISDKTEEIR